MRMIKLDVVVAQLQQKVDGYASPCHQLKLPYRHVLSIEFPLKETEVKQRCRTDRERKRPINPTSAEVQGPDPGLPSYGV